ncbi:MAG: hypothetical protein Q4F53_10470 [Nesterenkonia sp.]|uniref:hypothetical protein n=1 Tax=Nesterenkonia marinintestina TaxID=2979865 RepID=UPI0021BF97A1|nr:hypothetical protein [Nesterenkonia sp. GX14115]MDO5494017.1 hypothetical protein [Nesterenkonia sp.]
MTQNPYGDPQGTNPGVGPEQHSKFGTHAYDPHAAYGGPMERPKAFGRLRTLTIASMVVYLLSGVTAIITSMDEDMVRAQLEMQGVESSQEAVDMMTTFGLVSGVLMVVVALIVYLIVLMGLKKVKNWARILGTVFCGLGIIFTGFGMLGAGAMMEAGAVGIISLAISVIFLVINVLWLITAFSGVNNAYFADRAKR